MNTNKDAAIIDAFNKGYRVINGDVFYKGKKRKLDVHGWCYCFGVRNSLGKRINIKVHRLLGYQKFGDLIFNTELEVCHKDNIPLNNLDDNIIIRNSDGTKYRPD